MAAAMGGWSARHRWAAVSGWLLFVIAAMVIGQLVGQVDVDEDKAVPGEVRQAATLMDDAGLKDAAGEMVFVHSAHGTVADPAFHRAVADVVGAVEATGRVAAVTSPYDTGAISADRHSALVGFDVRGDADDAPDRVQPVLDAVQKVQGGHPDLKIAEIGDASSGKAENDAFGNDFKTAEFS
ncbi:hypothetical protein ACWCPT_34835, partial [Streptomyces sp. NPDC002308]